MTGNSEVGDSVNIESHIFSRLRISVLPDKRSFDALYTNTREERAIMAICEMNPAMSISTSMKQRTKLLKKTYLRPHQTEAG